MWVAVYATHMYKRMQHTTAMTSPTSHTRYDIEPPDASDASDATYTTHGSDDLVREEKFQFLLDLIRQQDAKIIHLAEALKQQGIHLTIIRDNDALETFKVLHMAQSLQHQVEDSAGAIKVLRIETDTLKIQHSTAMKSIVSLERFTGLEKHIQMLHLKDRHESQRPPQRALPSAPKPLQDKKKYTHKWLFGAQEPSALEALGLSPNL